MKFVEDAKQSWSRFRVPAMQLAVQNAKRLVPLVQDAKNAWRWFSIQSMVLAGAVQGAWLFVPADLRSSVPPQWLQGITIALMVMGIAGRLIKQTPDRQDNP